MRWSLFAASAAVALCLWLPGEAAPPGAPASETITFEQYREWRMNQIERRRDELAARLAAPDLSDREKARLHQIKGYYDWLSALPDSERDRRFHERFDRIDSNHDGVIDEAERTAWRDKQRNFYQRDRRVAARPHAEPPAAH